MFFAIVGSCVPTPSRAQALPREEALRLSAENDLLRKRVELATSNGFYLLLDPNDRSLTLMLQGAILNSYQVSKVEVGDPRVAFVSRGSDEDWQGRIWAGGALVPPRALDRVEIKPPPAGQESAEPVAPPPTPEEAYPVPSRYGIRFDGGLFLEMQPGGEDGSPHSMSDRLRHWFEDFKEVLQRHPKDQMRIRLSLRPEDMRSIYRSLPPDAKLLVVPAR